MSKKDLYKILKSINDLPALPSTLLEINKITRNPNVTVNDVSETLIRDPALTAKILKLANSPYYGLSHKISTLDQAITILGFNIIKNLAITVSIFKIFNRKTPALIDIKGLWNHSLGCAIASKSLLYNRDNILQEKAFLAGILHDIGKIIIAQNFPEDLNKILKRLWAKKSPPQNKLEKQLIGYSHEIFGSFASEKWLFPKELSESIKYHHNPHNLFKSLSNNCEKKNIITLSLSVHAGNQIAKALALGKSSDMMVDNINNLTWDYLNITKEKLPEIIFTIKKRYENIVTYWEF